MRVFTTLGLISYRNRFMRLFFSTTNGSLRTKERVHIWGGVANRQKRSEILTIII